jgi:hypothetical protein
MEAKSSPQKKEKKKKEKEKRIRCKKKKKRLDVKKQEWMKKKRAPALPCIKRFWLLKFFRSYEGN